MRNRLEIAKELLALNGSIYVNIDYNEVHYLKVLMDEIFGINNFKGKLFGEWDSYPDIRRVRTTTLETMIRYYFIQSHRKTCSLIKFIYRIMILLQF